MKTYRFSIMIEKDEEGYFAFCPELQGSYTQGDTYEDILENIKDAIRLHVNDRLDNEIKYFVFNRVTVYWIIKSLYNFLSLILIGKLDNWIIGESQKWRF